MYNLTLALDPDIVREAQILAAGEGATLNEKITRFLLDYAKVGSAVFDAMNPRANEAGYFANTEA